MRGWMPALALLATFTPAQAQVATPAPSMAPPPYLRPIAATLLTRAEVQTMALHALDVCEALGMPATVSVADADGSLRATISSDGAKIVGLETAPQKVAVVLAFRVPSRAMQQRFANDLALSSLFAKDTRFLFYPGGLPIYRGTRMVGAIAVGGARDNDEVCARAGLSAVSGLSGELRGP